MACDTKATANGTQLAYVKEVDCGVTPTTPTFQKIGIVSETLNRNAGNTNSSEVHSDRNIRDSVQTSVDESGAVNVEWRISALEDFLTSGLQANTVTTFNLAEAISLDATDQNAIELTLATTSGFAGVRVGAIFRIGGFAEAANNGIVRVVEVTSDDVIDVVTMEGKTFVTEAGGANTFYARSVINGQTKQPYTIERLFTEMVVPTYMRQEGLEVAGFNLAFGAQSIITGDVSFIGRTDSQAIAAIAGATYLDASNDPILNTVDSIGDVYEDGDAATTDVMSMTLALDNGSRGQTAIGTSGYVGVAHDACAVSGDLEVYFEDLVYYNNFKNQSKINLQYILTDTDGNSLAITMPKVKYTETAVNAEGAGTDLLAKGSFNANYDEALGGTIELAWLNEVV